MLAILVASGADGGWSEYGLAGMVILALFAALGKLMNSGFATLDKMFAAWVAESAVRDEKYQAAMDRQAALRREQDERHREDWDRESARNREQAEKMMRAVEAQGDKMLEAVRGMSEAIREDNRALASTLLMEVRSRPYAEPTPVEPSHPSPAQE